MKDLNYRRFRRFSIVLIIFFIIGCASEPVKVQLPASHPANPEAQEAEFIPPPNPFKQDATAMKTESKPDSMMMDKSHDKKNQKHMHHNDNQHGGHSQ